MLATVIVIVLIAVVVFGLLIFWLMRRSQTEVPQVTDARAARQPQVVGTDEKGAAILDTDESCWSRRGTAARSRACCRTRSTTAACSSRRRTTRPDRDGGGSRPSWPARRRWNSTATCSSRRRPPCSGDRVPRRRAPLRQHPVGTTTWPSPRRSPRQPRRSRASSSGRCTTCEEDERARSGVRKRGRRRRCGRAARAPGLRRPAPPPRQARRRPLRIHGGRRPCRPPRGRRARGPAAVREATAWP